jgi:UDP-N-acetylmuramoylalanyl-D-glutamate--2,6-diaminopimelate ligase (EC 6.3.2.13)
MLTIFWQYTQQPFCWEQRRMNSLLRLAISPALQEDSNISRGVKRFTAVVDYAHTPDALENVLKTLKDCAEGKEIVTVFGCGGNRDKTKRPEMAEVSARYSDRVVVTSDNPRFEEPEAIIDDIRKGFSVKDMGKTLFITDRREAIRTALIMAKPGSIVLIAGKGMKTTRMSRV